MGVLRRTLQKCLQKFFRENQISGRKTRCSQKSDRIFVKFPRLNCENRIPRKTFFTIFADFPQLYDFCYFVRSSFRCYNPQKSPQLYDFRYFPQLYDFCYFV
jgi:hypothetical protein